MKTIEERVKSIVAEQLGLEEDSVKLDSNFSSDLGADSLDQIELVMVIEDEFELMISDEEADKFITVGDVVHYISVHKSL